MRRTRIAFIAILSTMSSLGMGLLGSIYPIFVLNRFSASLLDVGMLVTIFGLVSAFFKAPAGKLVDMYGKERVFFVGVILSAVGTFAYLLAFDIIHLYLIEFFFGISYALQGPSRLALIMEISEQGKKGLTLGIFESAYDIAGSIAALIAALIVSYLGFEPLFFLCLGCYMATGILILKLGKFNISKPLSYSRQ